MTAEQVLDLIAKKLVVVSEQLPQGDTSQRLIEEAIKEYDKFISHKIAHAN